MLLEKIKKLFNSKKSASTDQPGAAESLFDTGIPDISEGYDSEKDAYKYTIRQLKNVNFNLDNVIWQKQEQSPLNVK